MGGAARHNAENHRGPKAGVCCAVIASAKTLVPAAAGVRRHLDSGALLAAENIIRGLRALLGLGYRMSIPVTPEQFADPGDHEAWQKEKNMTVLRL